MKINHLKRKGLLFEEWLNQRVELPEGFKEWKHTYSYWDQSNPLHWAIYQYSKESNRKNKKGGSDDSK